MTLGERLEKLLGGKPKGPTMTDSDFVPGWMDITPFPPEPITDWIERRHLDLPFGPDPKQKLDLYLPNGPQPGPVPLFVIAHGGGFTHMDKADWHVYPGFFALRRGWAVASVNYRLAPAHPFPAGLEDTKAALRWLAAHAGDFGFDPHDIALEGTSAGGNLVALAALQIALAAADSGEPAPLTIRSIALLCPATDLRGIWDVTKAMNPLIRLGMRISTRHYLGAAPRPGDDTIDRAGVYYWLDQAEAQGLRFPPAYIMQGEKDPLVKAGLAERLYARLAKNHPKPEDLVLEIIPGAGHAGGGVEFFDPDRLERLTDFFDAHRRPQ
jgi:acetyl esterase/lipase